MGTVPFVPAPNTLQVEMVYNTNGGLAENVYHVQGTGPYTDIDALSNALIDRFIAWDNSELKTARASVYSLQRVRVRDVGQEHGPVIERAIVQPGTIVSPPMPDNVTIAVKWTTGRGGRSNRGRTYHIGLTQAQCTGDRITDGSGANLVANYHALIAAISGTGFTDPSFAAGKLVVVSKRSNNAWRTTAQVREITDCALADFFLDSQRRRLIGRGT